MKPIEPGCLALARPHPDYNEPVHIVEVLRKQTEYNRPCRSNGCRDMFWVVFHPVYEPGRTDFYCACALTRIDGGDPDAITETEKEHDKCVSQ